MEQAELKALADFLARVPAVNSIATGVFDNGCWWSKFSIDIDHPLAWRVVQEFGHILNYLSISERLPTVFKPVSPPVYMNGGPKEYLSWVIETQDARFSPVDCAEWLENRMPDPIDDPQQWTRSDD